MKNPAGYIGKDARLAAIRQALGIE